MTQKTEPVFNTLVLYEKIERNRIKNLRGAKIDIVPLDEKKKLDKYVKTLTSEGYRVDYQLPELKNFGRVKEVPFTGLGTFCKEVRGYLANGVYIDVDMVNCHPVILQSVFKSEGIDTKIIDDYISNRSQFLEREKCEKTDVLKLINTSQCNHIGTLKKLHDQIYTLLLPSIQTKHPEIANHIKKQKKTHNIQGKVIANFLQEIEFKLLSELFHFCKKEGILVDVLMHDGFFVRITETINETLIKDKYLALFENVINEKFDIPMKFSVKQHNNTINLEENTDKLKTYEEVKREFEKNHCKIINKSFFIKESEENSIIVMKNPSLVSSYEHIRYQEVDNNGNVKPAVFIHNWLKDPEMRLYEDIDCYPDPFKCPENIFNTWRKFDMEYIKDYVHMPEELEEILNHIKVLCNHEQVVYDYFIKWIGQMIKYPEVKSICPILISNQGAGKGTFVALMTKMLGVRKVSEFTNPSRDVWGSFNGMMVDCFLVNINEIGKKDTMGSLGEIKGLITDGTININTKGVNSYKTRSFHRFIITTNNSEPIETTKDDRRNFIIRSSDEKVGNKDYFERLNRVLLEDVNVIKTCYEYFKGLEGLDKFGYLPIPKTEHQKNLQELSTSPIELWLKDLVYSTNEDIIQMTGKESYDSFKLFCTENGIVYDTNSVKLGVRVTNMNLKGVEKGRHTKYGHTKLYNTKQLRKDFEKVSFNF